MRAIAPDVLNALDNSHFYLNTLRLPGEMERKLYTAVNKVIEAAGGKWNRKVGGHVFPDDAREAIDQIILTGGVGAKQELGQFDTPPELAAQVIELVRIRPGMRVLEPSAGIGCLAVPAAEAGGKVLAVEIDVKRALKTLHALQPFDGVVLDGDFLAFEAAGQIGWADRVVMNPPFARQADIDHVMAAERCLNPGGILVAVMSASIGFRVNAKTSQFRSWLASRSGNITLLPENTFKSSGTSVNTCLVRLTARGRP